MSRFKSSTPISPGTTKTGGLRDKKAAARASKEKKSTPSNKTSNEKKAYGMQDNITKDEKATDKAKINVGSGAGEGRQTTDFIDDLKDAYKSGLFTGGTKTKAFMDKYNLDAGDIVKLRTGIDQGLGTRMGGQGGNVLTDIVGDLRQEGILATSGPGAEFLKQRASEIYEPGMKKSNMFLPFEDPQNIFEKGANFATQYNPFLNIVSGIFGSSPAQQATYFGNLKGLEGEDLDNFAAAVANDRNLYNQLMSTPEMQDYQVEKFRTDTVKQAMDKRQGQGDPNPISGTQPGEEANEGESDTDTGTETFTPAPQNFYTFFDPNLGRYRSGTYDEYLQYVTAKDGGIIQLQQGGALPNAPGGVLPQGRKTQLEDLFQARKEIQNLDTPTKSEAEGSRMIMADIDDKAKALSDKSKEGIMMAMTDQPAKDIFMANNPDIGPALRKDLKPFQRAGDSVMSLFMEAIRKGDITEGSANQYLEEALNNFVAAGIIPPNTSYDQLTDPFKDLVTREAAMIANSMAKPIDYLEGRDMESMQLPNMSFDTPDRGRVELPMTILKGKEGDESMIRRSTSTQDPTMYEVADGGIIGLKQGGMNDMMQADDLMFKDPSDKEEWEYNV